MTDSMLGRAGKEYVIDAAGKVLGRIASEAAVILQGKKQVGYHPRLAGADRVVIKNFSKVKLTGRKLQSKIYYRHTGYMGHLREETLAQAIAKSPQKVLQRAVYNMLPKNRLRNERMKRLKIEI